MAERFEYYITGDDGASAAYSVYWYAQTFTPATAHKITSVKLKLSRYGLPGTLTVGIRETDGDGHPTGGDLCSGTMDGDTITTVTAGEWYEITLGAGYDLEADTKYAIVIRAPGATFGNQVEWRFDWNDATYDGGCGENSSNSGSSWTSETLDDYMFEEWGEPPYETHELTVTDNIALTDALVKNPIKVLADSITLTDVLIKNPIKTFVDGIAFTDAWTGMLNIWRLLSPVRVLNAARNLFSAREEESE